MSLSKVKKRLRVAASWFAALLICASLTWAQNGIVDPSAPIEKNDHPPEQPPYASFPSIDPSDGSLGEFYPTQNDNH